MGDNPLDNVIEMPQDAGIREAILTKPKAKPPTPPRDYIDGEHVQIVMDKTGTVKRYVSADGITLANVVAVVTNGPVLFRGGKTILKDSDVHYGVFCLHDHTPVVAGDRHLTTQAKSNVTFVFEELVH